MNANPQTTRLVELLLGMLAALLIVAGLGLYALQEPQRIVNAQAAQQTLDLNEAMTLYAENCAVCHGLRGDGIGAIPALDTEALRTADSGALFKIIARGLYNTAMPAWSIEDGGPLSDYQINQMVLLIQFGDWQQTQDRVVNLGLAPRVPFESEPDPNLLTAVQTLPEGDLLARGIQVYAANCVACHGAAAEGGALAPALNTPDVRAKGGDELQRIVLYGVPGTLMANWQNALPAEDVTAVVNLLLQWESIPTGVIPAPEINLPTTQESLALGADLFAANCSRCHGPEGQGTPRAPSLNVKSFLADTNDFAIQQIVTLGIPNTAMTAWGDRLTDAEIQAIVGLIRSWEPTAPEVAQIARGGGGAWWQTTTGTGAGAATQKGGGPPWARNQPTAPAPSPTSVVQPLGATPNSDGAASPEVSPSATAALAPQTEHGNGPPWAQAQQPVEVLWYQTLDVRAWALLGGLLALGIGLLLLAWRMFL